jgi:RadC-like JAB domain
MSALIPSAVQFVPAPKVRRAHRRRPTAAPEAGVDLLQLTSRVSEEEARVLAHARGILLRLAGGRPGTDLTSPQLVREYLTTLLASQQREFFVTVSLDSRHRVIATDVLFAGTIDGTRVYPREVVKCALTYRRPGARSLHRRRRAVHLVLRAWPALVASRPGRDRSRGGPSPLSQRHPRPLGTRYSMVGRPRALTDRQVEIILTERARFIAWKALRRTVKSQRQLAREFGVSQSTICLAVMTNGRYKQTSP